jgi:hypothetical protein
MLRSSAGNVFSKRVFKAGKSFLRDRTNIASEQHAGEQAARVRLVYTRL